MATLRPDTCDLHIQEHPSEEQQTDSEVTLQTVEVKKEDSYDSMWVDEDMAVENDDSNSEYVNDEFVASNEEYLNEAKDPLKYENALFQCSLCNEQFESEPAYEQHMDMHGQAGAGDGERAASPACEARTAASSSCPDTSLRARHGRPVRKARRDPQPTDLHQPAVSPFVAMNTGHEVEPEEANLVRHIKTHTGKKQFCCQLCKYKCARSSRFLIHMRTHTGEKPYSCELCEYKCSRNDKLVIHMRTHTGEKPYSCELCEYKCARSDKLVIHMRSHTGEKPYSCELCEYKSAQGDKLAIHMRTHTGEKPYSCELCEYKSAHNFCVLRHMKIHVREPRELGP